MDKRLQQLSAFRTFEAASRHLSYSDAAKELFVSQAAVSQQIRSLEQRLNVKLFVRKGRRMYLTNQGETLKQHVEQAFELLVDGMNKIQSEPLEGILNVTCTQTFASRWLMPRLWRFSLLYPDVSVRVVATEVAEDIRSGSSDLAIRMTRKHYDGLVNLPFAESKVYPVCSPELASSMKFHSPEQLNECWLIQVVNETTYTWQRWFELTGSQYQANRQLWMEVNTADNGLSAVMAGHGACIAADIAVAKLIKQGLLVKPFDIEFAERLPIKLLYDEQNPRRERLKVFTDWAIAEQKFEAGTGPDPVAAAYQQQKTGCFSPL